MTLECALFSLLKSLWLRSTGQPGWCNCVICKDEMLNLPDPLGFSQDARKFQKQLRKIPKTYKCKPCIPTKDHHYHSSHHINNEKLYCTFTPEEELTPRRRKSSIVKHDHLLLQPFQPTKAMKTVSFSDPLEQHRSPEGDATSNGYSEGYAYIHESKMDECEEDEDGKWKCISEIIRSMEMRADASTSSAKNGTEGNYEATCTEKGNFSLYAAQPPRELPISAERAYHENDSNDSYGTITSQEILEAYERAAEELALTSVTNLGKPPPPCFYDKHLYTDVVHLSSKNCTDV